MENKEADRIVVSKPVASRPSSSFIQPFSDLLAGAIRGSLPCVGPETGTGPIKPKTVKFKPTLTHGPPPSVSSQGDAVRSDIKPPILHKPLAKAVSKVAMSVLANMGKYEPRHRQEKPSSQARIDSVEHQVEKPYSLRTQPGSSFQENLRNLPATASGDCSSSLPVMDSRDLPAPASVDRPSYDGYNWRKYGQKQVKGSEYPRSYYKCTHPNCPVKKKVERSLDGQIAEIVYKGEHNHSKPQPPKRGLGTGQDIGNPLIGSRVIERNEGSEGGVEATTDINLKRSLTCDRVVDRDRGTAGLNLDDSCSPSEEYVDGAMGMNIDPDEPRSKRRKTKKQLNGVEINGESPQEPRVPLQGSVDPEILDDGFRWRKYGQKVVKGNPYPRSYYKCTSIECSVRKYVERAQDDPKAFITTYEGKHNHEMPIRSVNVPSSESTPRATANKERAPA
ncbi:probable WRKY transcription factor 3 [Punica granatum]|uniref:WRKY domain-containing protein n=2 Tax=Punica granatum TaxID=22663 RepID=A0A218VVJ8_PUNGR|nr:probable WRKY transcription factor 3 [Punica granatum]XP_031396875.1 probable WRKY transcription factor 3 [Punica granatum]OWM64584.1 hypothetical protein CDL15_Pgr020551 [Punica granatum]PKI60971.1 hypothetical protein CRG98_018601 [Punica granatum]